MAGHVTQRRFFLRCSYVRSIHASGSRLVVPQLLQLMVRLHLGACPNCRSYTITHEQANQQLLARLLEPPASFAP